MAIVWPIGFSPGQMSLLLYILGIYFLVVVSVGIEQVKKKDSPRLFVD
jgi:hypothetical protein